MAGLLLASGILYVGPAHSDRILHPVECSLARIRPLQYSPGDQRDLCLQDCGDAYGQWFGFGSSNYAYARCVQDCESKFWHEFDRSMRELEREGNSMK
jgi:hypothetical protein